MNIVPVVGVEKEKGAFVVVGLAPKMLLDCVVVADGPKLKVLVAAGVPNVDVVAPKRVPKEFELKVVGLPNVTPGLGWAAVAPKGVAFGVPNAGVAVPKGLGAPKAATELNPEKSEFGAYAHLLLRG